MINLDERLRDAVTRFTAMQRRREDAEQIRLECEAEMLRLQGEIRLLEALLQDAGAHGNERTAVPDARVRTAHDPRPVTVKVVAGHGPEDDTARPSPDSKP